MIVRGKVTKITILPLSTIVMVDEKKAVYLPYHWRTGRVGSFYAFEFKEKAISGGLSPFITATLPTIIWQI